jgi:transposase
VRDCEWIAQLLQHGLLKGSFVPPRPIRELRDLTRQRAQLLGEKAQVVNRIHKVLEDANVKLASVASDIMGVSGRDMLQALVEGVHDPDAIAELARRRLRGKIPQLKLALQGRVTEHHRFMLETHLKHLASVEKLIDRLSRRIAKVTRPFAEEIELLETAPGVERRTAENVLAEIGTNMEQYPSAAHLASWAGICPGNNASAGKNKSGKTTKGSKWLRRALVESAWGASHTRGTYAQAQYQRLAARRGRKRALVAVGHTQLVAMYHILKLRVPYRELGPEHFNRLNPEGQTKYYVRRLEALGHKVTLEPVQDAA